MKILAFDQATQICGWAFFNGEKLKNCGQEKFNDKDTIIRIFKVKQWTEVMIQKYKPDAVIFEDTQAKGNIAGRVLDKLLGVLECLNYEKGRNYFIVEPIKWKSVYEIKSKKRLDQKKECIEIAKRKFGIDVTEDTADAIGLGWWGVVKLSWGD